MYKLAAPPGQKKSDVYLPPAPDELQAAKLEKPHETPGVSLGEQKYMPSGPGNLIAGGLLMLDPKYHPPVPLGSSEACGRTLQAKPLLNFTQPHMYVAL